MINEPQEHTNRFNWIMGLTKECPACNGCGAVHETIGNNVMTQDCPRCDGGGYVMESENDK